MFFPSVEKTVPPLLAQPARFGEKSAIFLVSKNAKCLQYKKIKIFIFFENAQKTPARFVLCGFISRGI